MTDTSSATGPQYTHAPVLIERVIELLGPALIEPGAIHLDATLGMGGHAEAVLTHLPQARVIGLDRDPFALAQATDRLRTFGERFVPVHAVYDEIPSVLRRLGHPSVHSILFDLGVSSRQLDEPQRGFAYRFDAPLDMRMDPGTSLTAADVLNTYSAADLARIVRDYGEERYARKIAGAIVRERAEAPFTTSGRLVELLHRVIPVSSQKGGHPAKRTFQALRIEVNAELEVLAAALPAAIESLEVGGRVAVLSYHSLEDRMVKNVLGAGSRGRTPPGLPVELPDHAAYLRLLTRGGEPPSEGEIRRNPRASSARLRAAERTRRTKGANG